MPRSLSLAAYLAYQRRKAAAGADEPPPYERPPGPLVWAHAATPADVAPLMQVLVRLRMLQGDAGMLLSLSEDLRMPSQVLDGVLVVHAPPERASEAAAFIHHWRPDYGIWGSGHLRPALIHAAQEAGVPMALVNATLPAIEQSPWKMVNMTAHLLTGFERILARDGNTLSRIERLGVPRTKLHHTGALQDGGIPLPHDEDAYQDLSEQAGTRPVWLAAMVQPDEEQQVIQAHRAVLRSAHRLLLVLHPDDPSRAGELAGLLAAEGMRAQLRSAEEQLDDMTQVLIADLPGELGLWYRLAPVAFMGSSLRPGHGGRNPYAPAALGSAILYGPNVRNHLQAYSRLAAAGAARIVMDASSLAQGVQRLLAPDQAAAMAHAAWEVTSEGAEVTDALLEHIQDVLDGAEGR